MLSRLSINLGQRLTLTSNRSSSVTSNCILFRVVSARPQSTVASKPTASVLNIPEDIPKESEISETILKFHPNGEPTLESLGLGGYCPTGLIQKSLEMMHVYYDMPWWVTVVIGTVFLRLLIVPFMIKAQKYNENMKLHLPEIRKLSSKVANNINEVNKPTIEMRKFMKEKGISVPKMLAVTFVPVPVFISMFIGLRAMATTPIESLKEGGLWWCKDLTIADPYYILPALNCLTIYLTLERNFHSNNVVLPIQIKNCIRVIPIVMFPFLANFEGIMLCYFITTNIFTLIQIEVLQLERVRLFFGLPKPMKHESENSSVQSDFMKTLTTALTNIQEVNKSLKNKSRDTIQFNKMEKDPTENTCNKPKN